MQVLIYNIAALAGFFVIPLVLAAIGFIVNKSTGKTWGYKMAGAALAIQLIIMVIVFLNKSKVI